MKQHIASFLEVLAVCALQVACSKGGADSVLALEDATLPAAGVVRDGTGEDLDVQSALDTISANWTGFPELASGTSGYEWSIGSGAGLADLQPWVSVGTETCAVNTALTLVSGGVYYVSVRATDGVGNHGRPAHSDGVLVDLDDVTGPTPGTVNDGTGDDIDQQTSTTEISANWSGFTDSQSGLASYEWAIGKTSGGTDVLSWVSVGTATSATKSGLSLGGGTTCYVSVRGIDHKRNVGRPARSDGVELPPGQAGSAGQASQASQPGPAGPAGPGASISQFGITWTFADTATTGQFANGDWWVVGRVVIVRIDPPSVPADGRTRNGSMLDPAVTSVDQAYDSSMYGSYSPGSYVAANNVALGVSAAKPLVLEPGRSLVSTISVPEAGAMPQLRTAAVLTCVASAPAAGSFRPAYAKGTDKTVRFNKSQLQYGLLGKLSPVAGAPPLAAVERMFERPWIDHAPGWLARAMHPADNMPDYGREVASQVGIGALMLQLDLTDQQKEKLLCSYVQLGIDLYGIVAAGGLGHWEPNGGHGSGRKWPILFAGVMLGDAAMSGIGQNKAVAFGEDGQTFVVRQTSPGVWNFGHGGYTAADDDLPEWGFRHSVDPATDKKDWEADPYRTCCTANAWAGFVLAARVMDQRTAWNHPPLFDYQDRYLQIERIEWRRFWDAGFTGGMWQRYRPQH